MELDFGKWFYELCGGKASVVVEEEPFIEKDTNKCNFFSVLGKQLM